MPRRETPKSASEQLELAKAELEQRLQAELQKIANTNAAALPVNEEERKVVEAAQEAADNLAKRAAELVELVAKKRRRA